MRVEQVKIYTLSELSQDAQEKAHQDYISSNHFEWNWMGENKDTLYEFAKIFPVKVKEFEYDNNYANVEWSFTESDEIENLKGLRLRTYIINNYWKYLYTPEYRKQLSCHGEKSHKHRKVKCSKLSNGKMFCAYYSSGINYTNSCVLTGYCLDDDILQPVYDFLKNPSESVTFFDLMSDCFEGWEKAVKAECENQLSFEYFKDIAEANDYEFKESGERY